MVFPFGRRKDNSSSFTAPEGAVNTGEGGARKTFFPHLQECANAYGGSHLAYQSMLFMGGPAPVTPYTHPLSPFPLPFVAFLICLKGFPSPAQPMIHDPNRGQEQQKRAHGFSRPLLLPQVGVRFPIFCPAFFPPRSVSSLTQPLFDTKSTFV